MQMRNRHMKWRPRGEGRDGGEREREREDLETSHECSHARSLNIRTEAMRRGGEGCDGAAVGRE